MLKKLIVLTMVLALAAFAAAVPNVIPAPKGLEMYTAPLIASESESSGALPMSGDVFQTAGDQGGITTYDYQSNGAMGNRIAVDADGDVHISWMHDDDANFANRDIYYNVWKKSTGDFIWPSGIKASGTAKAGYATMGLLSDGRAVVAYHHDPDGDGIYQSVVSIDALPKGGAFSSPIDVDATTVPNQPIWPKIAVGPDNVIHVTAHVYWDGSGTQPSDYNYLYYSRSTDGGVTFSPWQILSQNAGNDAAVAISKNGSKVAIAWVFGFPIAGATDKLASHGNVCYIESTNSGASWSSETEVTDGFYGEYSPNTSDSVSMGAICNSLDCAYDAAGNLHIAWGDAWRAGYENPDDEFKVYYSYYARWFQRMMHWSEVTNEPNLASGKYTQFTPLDDEGNIIEQFDMGFWGLGPSVEGYAHPWLGCGYPQLSAIGSGDDMVYTWVGQWDSLDYTAAGTINGDLYATISTDGGATWGAVKDWTQADFSKPGYGYIVAYATNLTNSHSPNAKIGESLDEDYPSMWPWIGSDSILHITYNHDLFAGSVVNAPTENISTNNPVMYLGANEPSITKIYVGSGPEPSGVEEAAPRVEAAVVELIGEHPVTNSVAFSVSVPGSHASLKIYDAAGNLVETLFEGELNGTRMLTWNASAAAAGVYFYYFATPTRIENGRVVVVH
jgi:hypothetical protein